MLDFQIDRFLHFLLQYIFIFVYFHMYVYIYNLLILLLQLFRAQLINYHIFMRYVRIIINIILITIIKRISSPYKLVH